jgi:integrase/recombinase XerD
MSIKYSKEWLRTDEVRSMLVLPELQEKYEIWILLLYTPALRVSEGLNIRVRDIDLKGECIEIWKGKGKQGELQKAPCDIATLKKIIRYAEHSNLRPNDYIMYSNKSEQVHRSQVYRVLNAIVKDAGIEKKIGTHTLRRSRAQHLLDAGLPLVYVSKLLRHKNLSTTMSYLNVSVSDIQREMEKIEVPTVM